MKIITGDCMDELAQLEEHSVHSVMTSPPYWNLRDYGHTDQLGLEETSDEYVQNMADVFDAVKRVLRDDGSLWLNLGDTYEDKDLQLIPERVALELQDRGWILRNKVTWAKPNPMPQSVKDRLNDTTEKVFHFVKNKDYWYDLDAIREEHSESSLKFKEANRDPAKYTEKKSTNVGKRDGYNERSRKDYAEKFLHPSGKNPGDVFEVTTKPFPEAHFAVYPPELCEKPIKATVPPKVCKSCGKGYERQTIDTGGFVDGECKVCGRGKLNHAVKGTEMTTDDISTRNDLGNIAACSQNETKGWEQTCNCETDKTTTGIILDPFAGAGTTLLKAKELNRDAIGIELNPEYADMARARVGLDVHDPSTIRGDDDQNGLEQFI